ncbi:MAG: ATP-binding cassette domain-containing protein [Pseudomonadota bacterium]|nr:ATP-binding cassette domain-containing protein [Pseudomonadota bacterium]
MKSSLINIDKLSLSFGNKRVLKDLDLQVGKGESLVIIGGSGEGKSVLLKCILGLLHQDSGSINFMGAKIIGENKQQFLSQFGMLFQGAALFDSMPVWENISFRYKYSKMFTKTERKDLAKEKLALVGLSENTADLFPAELSGGMQKRVGIARAIASNPKILFFDEPTSGLDPRMAHNINKLLQDIIIKLSATTVTITHDVSSVKALADKVALLESGSIAWQGKTNEFNSTDHPNVSQFKNPSSF